MNNHLRDGRSQAEPTKAESLRLLQRADATRPRRLATLAGSLIVLAVAAGCAKTAVTRRPVSTGQLPRPAKIWVYDFAATAADLPAGSVLRGQIPGDAAAQTPEYIATARQLGAQIAAELVAQIRGMGMPAARAVAITKPRINDVVIRGCVISFDEGDAKKRVGIGLGRGSSELKAAAEGLQMTAQGLRRLGSGATDAGGSKTPGAAVGAAAFVATANPVGLIVGTGMKVRGERTGSSKVEGRAEQTAKEIADVLKERFQQQGWID
jgi:hypothetical protein